MSKRNVPAAAVCFVLAAGSLALPILVMEDPPIMWMFGGFVVFGLAAAYNLSPIYMADFFKQARETYKDVRQADDDDQEIADGTQETE